MAVYYTNKARKDAVKRIDELVAKLSNAEPTEYLDLHDIGDLLHYLAKLESAIKREMGDI